MSIDNTTSILLQENREPVAISGKKSLEFEKKRLMKAAKEMESVFLYQVMQAMRSAIPKADEEDGLGMGGGLGKDIYTQMFDQELARNMAGVSDRSLAGVLYRSLEEVLEKQAGTGPEDETVEKSLFPTPTYLPIKKETPDAAKSVKSSDEITSNSQNDDYREHVKTAAQKYKISAELIEAIIKRESGGNPGAVSEAGAKGLMQLTDTTAADMGVDDVFNPAQNIDGGSKYLRKMIDRFGNLELALGAYNAGPATVDKYGGVPPYPETRNYIKTVLAELSAKLPDK